jgi:uncharacterized protein DUF4365
MPGNKDPWFVLERSEALAGLLLTARNDVRVRHENKRDDGVDFLVEVNTGEPISARVFVVEVKGTTSSDQSEWMAGVSHLFPHRAGSIFLPACLFVINVRSNESWYAWVAQPVAGQNAATLKFFQAPEFHPLDPTAVDEIVDRVKAWYDVLPKQYACQKN